MKKNNFGYGVQAVMSAIILCCVLFVTGGFGQSNKDLREAANLGSGVTLFTFSNRTPITINDNSTASAIRRR